MSRPIDDHLGAEETVVDRDGEPSVVGTDTTSEATISARARSQKQEMRLLTALFILELSLAVAAIALYMKGARSFLVFLSSRAGMAFILAIPALVLSGAVIVRRYLVTKRSPSSPFRLIVAMNLISVLLILSIGEIAVRAGTEGDETAEVFLNMIALKPRSWERAKLRAQQLSAKNSDEGFLPVYDPQMGWSIGPNRFGFSDNKGEISYWSSSEGLRYPGPEGGAVLRIEGQKEIALVGDSFAFGYEVRYEDTWGYGLDQMLGEKFRVLNFGVPGYGLGQMYLRYEKDVRKGKPDVVLLGFIRDDLYRTLRVYPFLHSPKWGVSFSKPRFVLQDGELTIVNVPPLSFKEFSSIGSISQLPFIEYDRGYRPMDWEEEWYHVSYLVRLLTSLYSPWSAPTTEGSDEELLSVNAAILKTFMDTVKRMGSIPLVVLFPTKEESEQAKRSGHGLVLGKQVLERAGIPYIDTFPCLLELGQADAYLVSHFSSQGNEAIAKCLVDPVRQALGERSG